MRKKWGEQANSFGERGFTLIEVLVALTILSIALVPLYRIYISGMRLTMTGEDYSRALVVAEAIMAEAAIQPTEAASRSGNVGGRFDWELNISPFEQDEMSPPLFSIRSVVSWGDVPQRRNVTLQTYRVAPMRDGGK